ncbi:hypothetical protein GCM10022252_14000 [Streptosporangium oxazolinicum]|uniref:Uncharacterized protein n=1 Tax=Streptosporangium oxazolinicum TaxID=909287 RepID=A0ABP8AIY0_9ACTN
MPVELSDADGGDTHDPPATLTAPAAPVKAPPPAKNGRGRAHHGYVWSRARLIPASAPGGPRVIRAAAPPTGGPPGRPGRRAGR